MAIETNEKTYDEKLQKQLKELLDSGKVNASTVAKGINRSPAAISCYLKSNYDGRVDVVEEELKKYLSFFEKKEQVQTKSL